MAGVGELAGKVAPGAVVMKAAAAVIAEMEGKLAVVTAGVVRMAKGAVAVAAKTGAVSVLKGVTAAVAGEGWVAAVVAVERAATWAVGAG